ncbi:MAG: alpha/beta hydrolase, partial [Rhizobiaceae bacterium]|nr:alpha/beta hydrolase [Rhizobiaceae bacterium]
MSPPAPAFADVAYGSASAAQALDIHLPEGEGPFPYLVSLHGGAFRLGDKAQEWPSAEVLAKGIAIVFINYRLTGEAIWPAQSEDVLAAIAFLKAKGADYRLVPGRFVLMGQSAGGFLAVSAALSLTEAGTPPAAVVNFYGPMDFGAMDADMQALGRTAAMGATDAADSPESILMGKPVGENRAEATAMGPIGRLAAKAPGTPLPPLMIRHGDADPLISHRQAERLKEAWTRVDTATPL